MLSPKKARVDRWSVGRACTLAVVGLALVPANAPGHAAFLEAEPEPGTRLVQAPAEITLTFTESLDPSLSDASLTNLESGEEAPVKLAGGGEREILLRPERGLARGPYLVEWHTVSTVDGHALEGSFGFGVRAPPAAGEQALEQSPLARDGWLRIGARAVFYGALFFFAGGVLTAALLRRRDGVAGWLFPRSLAGEYDCTGGRREGLVARARRRTLGAGWIAVAAAVAVALAEAWDAGGSLNPASVSDFLLTNEAGLARVGAAVAVALAALWAPRWPLAASAWLGIAFFAIAIGGHANSAEPRALAVATDFVHLLAGAVWIGGIAQVASFWLPLTRRGDRALGLAAMRSVLPRFGRVALPAFLLLAATGLANAVIELGDPDALWQSAYGRVLAVKIALVALIALASYGHAVRLRPRLIGAGNPHPAPNLERRHWRLLAVEPLLAVGVIGVAAALVAFPLPPQQLGETDEAEAAAPCEGCPLPRAAPDQLAVAGHAGPNIAAFWLRRSGDGLDGTARLLDLNSRPVEAELELAGGEVEACGVGCWRLALFEARARVSVSITIDGEPHSVTVPSSWRPRDASAARRLLQAAQRRLRSLRSLRLHESVNSGAGARVRTDYRFQAPDRMAYRTSSGTRIVAIGNARYLSTAGGPFEKDSFGASGFRLDSLFRWTAYARSVQRLRSDRRSVTLAVFDPATPVWYRLRIDRSTLRIVDERMIAEGHFMRRRYFAFDRPVSIAPPRR